ncbi:MAG TPA: hypothetical protein DCP75_12975, partial [Haliea salexigens]|nr:hypothetical protein [Haliea salexigens]
MNVPPGRGLDLLCRNGSETDRRRLHDNASFLKKLAKLDSIEWLDASAQAPVAATGLVGDLELLVPLAG